jgi:uncharacterized iron-regulated membrane protein
MKIGRRPYQIYWDVHAWLGIGSALLLYVMFFAGAFALFYPELDRWAQPSAAEPVALSALQPLYQQLLREQDVFGRAIAIVPAAGGLDAYWSVGPERHQLAFDPRSGRLSEPGSELGSFLYQLHFLNPLPYGIYIAGFAGMSLALVLVTGLLLQLKDLTRQLTQFRPERAPRVWLGDLHKVLGVLGLPFQCFYAWSGTLLCLSVVSVEPLLVSTVFHGHDEQLAELRGEVRAVSATGRRSHQLPDLDHLLQQAGRELPGFELDSIAIDAAGDEASQLTLRGRLPTPAFASASLVVRADGTVIQRSTPANANALQRFEAWFYGLHYAHFGGHALKFLSALLAFATCAVIITGNWIWLARREKRAAHAVNRWLSRLTAGVATACPLATALLFMANRTLPEGLAQRVAFEKAVFGLAFAAALLLALTAKSLRQQASLQLMAAGVLLALVPLCDRFARPAFAASPLARAIGLVLALLALACFGAGAWLRVRAPRNPARATSEVLLATDDPPHERG